MNTNETWISRLVRKRDALYSPVMVVETNDDRRIKEYLQFLVPNESALSNRKVLIYDTYAGLSQAGWEYNDEGGKVIELPTKTGDDLFGDALAEIQKILVAETKKGKKKGGLQTTVILKNILEKDNVKNQALNLFSSSDDIIGFGHTLVLFTPDKGLVNPQVLEKCQLITPPLSLPSERMTLLQAVMGPAMYDIELSQEDQDRMVIMTSGLDLNQTEGVFCETLMDYIVNGRRLDLTMVSQMKADQINKTGNLRVEADVRFGFERVGGYEPMKRFITESIIMPMQEPERAKAIGIEQPKGAIIFGPPGTGKTIFAKALAKELGLPFVTLDPENFMSSYVGESERNLRNSIQIIEAMAPVVVFIDESMN